MPAHGCRKKEGVQLISNGRGSNIGVGWWYTNEA